MLCCSFPVFSYQALNEALQGLTFTPEENSNALNTDDLASMTFTVNDLGLSGQGGAQASEALNIHFMFDAINDGPQLNLPGTFAAQEDVPLLLSGISVSDTDYDEPGGEALLDRLVGTIVVPQNLATRNCHTRLEQNNPLSLSRGIAMLVFCKGLNGGRLCRAQNSCV